MATTDSSAELVFVYGTLKRRQSNHHWLAGARFLGRSRLAGATLHDLGEYPMAVLTPGSSSVIHGELFELGAGDLERLDQLEDYPCLYDRQVLTLSGGQQAWVYSGRAEQVAGCQPVPHGDWGTTPVFSYGSNLDPDRLRSRCPQWDGSGVVARLDGWQWGISKRADGGGGEGFAGIEPRAGARCWGVVHHLSPGDVDALDGYEGVATQHYRHQTVTVSTAAGERCPVRTYVPCPHRLAPALRASLWYARHILRGADHWQLPADWCQHLREALLMKD